MSVWVEGGLRSSEWEATPWKLATEIFKVARWQPAGWGRGYTMLF